MFGRRPLDFSTRLLPSLPHLQCPAGSFPHPSRLPHYSPNDATDFAFLLSVPSHSLRSA
jgi:hypothetical protein